VDDQLVDVVVKMMERGIELSASCAGHFEGDGFSPYIRFHAHQFGEDEGHDDVSEECLSDLSELRELAFGLNKNDTIDVSGIHHN
jgi:hypothetical protein